MDRITFFCYNSLLLDWKVAFQSSSFKKKWAAKSLLG